MEEKRRRRISKYLSKHLRHRPERLAIRVGKGGWVSVDELLAALEERRFPVSRKELETVVEGGEKPRFSFDDRGVLIRANYGHSIPVDLDLSPASPPWQLFHGTAEQVVHRILSEGLKPMARRYVHLYEDADAALEVGRRHGRPVLLRVLAGQLADKGEAFYHAAGGVWLVNEVPPAFLEPDLSKKGAAGPATAASRTGCLGLVRRDRFAYYLAHRKRRRDA